ncbi:cell division protein FtsQ/DivIB [Tuberibacillus calidus]|jgi:cell division protein FtsQ|uniref:cell division protein FtsQ/DivIB n=1 Tax=Tuberibacillus calidus TaxID=340097 RepID=UPI00042A2388|nr:FtsQ-type POTRA domain-containing protein [Tuberibacillus calidus]
MTDKKVIHLDDRIPKLKERRRQKANRRLIIYSTIFFLLIAVLVYLVSPISNVRHLVVKGNHHISADAVKKAAHLSEKSKIWDVNAAKAEADIKKLIMVKEADVRKQFPATVDIRITEYRRIAYLKNGDVYIPILENGAIVKQDPEQILPTDAPIIHGFKEGAALESLAKQLTRMPPALVHTISEILPADEAKGEDLIVLYMNGGQQVLAEIGTLADKMKLYPGIMTILSEDKKGRGVIDLTMGASWRPLSESKDKKTSGK